MLILPGDGVEAGEILLHVVEELEPVSRRLGRHWRPAPHPHGVGEATKPAFGAKVVVPARLDSRVGGGCLPSPPAHLLPPLLDYFTVTKFAIASSHKSAGVPISARPKPIMLTCDVVFQFSFIKTLYFTLFTLQCAQQDSLFFLLWTRRWPASVDRKRNVARHRKFVFCFVVTSLAQ